MVPEAIRRIAAQPESWEPGYAWCADRIKAKLGRSLRCMINRGRLKVARAFMAQKSILILQVKFLYL